MINWCSQVTETSCTSHSRWCYVYLKIAWREFNHITHLSIVWTARHVNCTLTGWRRQTTTTTTTYTCKHKHSHKLTKYIQLHERNCYIAHTYWDLITSQSLSGYHVPNNVHIWGQCCLVLLNSSFCHLYASCYDNYSKLWKCEYVYQLRLLVVNNVSVTCSQRYHFAPLSSVSCCVRDQEKKSWGTRCQKIWHN